MKTDNYYDLAEITERIANIHIQQASLHKEEQELIRQLVTAQEEKKLGLSLRRVPGSSIKRRCTAGGDYQTIEEIVQQAATPSSARSNTYVRENRQQSDHKSADKTDRFGKELKVGDCVEFLTDGLYQSKTWKIYKLTNTRVLCKRKGSQKTHRAYHNVKKVE